jgi:phage baseplate assembly protein W
VIDWAPSSVEAEVLQNVRFILASFAGAVPLARSLGLSASAVDAPASKARALLMTATLRAIQRNEPRARVVELYVDDLDAIGGQFSPRVRIEI